jgi:hypothetical protein
VIFYTYIYVDATRTYSTYIHTRWYGTLYIHKYRRVYINIINNSGLELSFRVGVRGVFGVKNNTRVPRDRVGPWSRGVGDGPSPTEKN